jgi:hypothetical protein
MRVPIAVLFAVVFSLAIPLTAAACSWGAQQYYAGTFFAGQESQGQNYYYGAYGSIATKYPPDPRDPSHPVEHVNVFIMSWDAGTNGATCCWSSAGWFVGNNIANNPRSTATTYAELVDDITPPGVITVGDPMPSSTWFETVQNGQLPNGRYRYDAYWYYGGVWKWGGYAELSSTATEQEAKAEASNPGDGTFCHRIYMNREGSLQLLVGGIGWQYWRPSPEGRWANIVVNNPYKRNPVTDYTDQDVGGP